MSSHARDTSQATIGSSRSCRLVNNPEGQPRGGQPSGREGRHHPLRVHLSIARICKCTPKPLAPPCAPRHTLQPTHSPTHPRRDLRRRCGPPIDLVGSKFTIFRHESAEWHGASSNNSSAPRHVLVWSFASSDLAGVFKSTKG